jgi:hypothetical protein
MTGTVKIKKKVGKRTVTKATSVVLASTRYKLAKGRSGSFNLTLTKTGRSSLAKANASSPLRATLIASVKGGATARKSVVVGGSQFVGSYALTVAPNFCGPQGNAAGQVMYVQGTAVTDLVPAGPPDPAGPFTGTASAQGTDYHLVLMQPANEIVDDITITLSNGGNDITGTGQDNLEAGNNVPCPVSFTGVRTSTSVPTSVPTSAPTTTTTAPPATTTTTTTVLPTTTTQPATTTSAAPCTAQAITAAAESATNAPTSLDTFGCSGSFAYADVEISSPSGVDGDVLILMAVDGAWQGVGYPFPCGSMPAAIYQAAKAAGYCM